MNVSLKIVLAILSVAVFSIAALTRPTSLVMWSVIVLTLTLLVSSVILSVTKPDGSKTFWIWFSIALLGYLVLAVIPDRDGNIPQQTGPSPTARLLIFSYEQLWPEPEPPAAVATKPAPPPVNLNGFGGGVGGIPDPFTSPETLNSSFVKSVASTLRSNSSQEESKPPLPFAINHAGLGIYFAQQSHFRRFMIIGHCIWAISLGLVLGCIVTTVARLL